MSTEIITTKFVVEGEKDYLDAMEEIRRSLLNVNTQLDAAKKNFENQQNVIEQNLRQNEYLCNTQVLLEQKLQLVETAVIEAQNAFKKYGKKAEDTAQKIRFLQDTISELDEQQVKNIDEWNDYADQLKRAEKELEELENCTEDVAEKKEKLCQQIAGLRDQMNLLEGKVNGTSEAMEDLRQQSMELETQLEQEKQIQAECAESYTYWQTQMQDVQVELSNTRVQLEENKKSLDEVRESTDENAVSVDNHGKTLKKATDRLSKLSEALETLGIKKVSEELCSMLEACAESAETFETAMTQALVGIDSSEWGNLSDELLDISGNMGISATELAGAAQQALSAGIDTEHAAELVATAEAYEVMAES